MWGLALNPLGRSAPCQDAFELPDRLWHDRKINDEPERSRSELRAHAAALLRQAHEIEREWPLWPSIPSPSIRGELAEAFETLRLDLIDDPVREVLDCIRDAGLLPTGTSSRDKAFSLYQSRGADLPAPVEAVAETARRLRDLAALRIKLEPLTIGAVVAGSVSYGAFFRVHGAVTGKPSDLDLLVILRHSRDLLDLLEALDTMEGRSPAPARQLRGQCEMFRTVIERWGPAVFAVKIVLYERQSDPDLPSDFPADYVVSLRLIAEDHAREILIGGLAQVLEHAGTVAVPTVRTTPLPEGRIENLTGAFSGRFISGVRCARPLGNGLHLEDAPVWTAAYERLYLGRLVTSIVPLLTVGWGGERLRALLDELSSQLQQRLDIEHLARPMEVQNLLLAHARSRHFSPAVKRRLREQWAL